MRGDEMEAYLEELLEKQLLEYLNEDFLDDEDLLDELVEV